MSLAARYRAAWTEAAASPAQLAIFRVAFFSAVALDAWARLWHAARFTGSDFNVSHLPALDPWLPLPSPGPMLFVCALQGLLAVTIALGRTRPAVTASLLACAALSTLWSQLDSWQHHWLVLLLLGLTCFLDLRAEAPRPWAVRLLLAQASVVYGWAAVAKLTPGWLNGSVLAVELREPVGRQVAIALGGFGVLAWLIPVVEVFLAVGLQVRALRPWAAVVGTMFHLGVELVGLRVGAFSLVMGAFLTLAWPERLAQGLSRVGARLGVGVTRPRAALVLAAVGSAALLAFPFPFLGVRVALVVSAGVLAFLHRRQPRNLMAHAAACVGLLLFCAVTDASGRFERIAARARP